MASLRLTSSKRLVVLGKDSKEVVRYCDEMLLGTGIEISSEKHLPLTSNQNDCTLIVLDSESQSIETLTSLLTRGLNKTIILNLEDLNLARLSNEVPHELLWLASKEPSSILGALSDGFQGAYWRAAEIVVSKLNQVELFGVGEAPLLSASEKQSILVGVLVARICGINEDLVQKKLESYLRDGLKILKKNKIDKLYVEAQ